MEQLKVKKKGGIVVNVVLHLLLSFFFLYIQHAYRHHLSPFSEVYFKRSLEMFWYIAAFIVISGALIWRHHRYSLLLYKISIGLVSFKVVEGLFVEFNKIIVITMFFYLTISYFLYQYFAEYLKLASINPNYKKTDLFSPLLKELPCEVSWGEERHKGILSNWDSLGCFVKLESKTRLPKKVQLKVFFQDREFVHEGAVVAETKDCTGFGLKFEEKEKSLDVFNWSEFMEIVQELGFQPERLR